MPTVIGIAGSYGGLNVGDEAILTAAIAELRAAVPHAEIVAFSRDAGHTRGNHDVDRAVGARDVLREELGPELERLDLLLLGGGGILYEREASSYLRVVRLAAELGVPTATYAIGVGPLERSTERQAVAETLNRMERITVREAAAKRLLEEIGVDREVFVTADPALLLEPLPFTEEMLEREGISRDRRLVGMSVREPGGAAEALDEDAYHALLANAADFLVDRLEADVVFVPMERADVREAHRVVGQMAFPERATVLKRPYRPSELLGLMGHLEMAVGMRLHFLIFAAVAGVPILGLPYASKVTGFLEALGLPTPQPAQREHTGALLASIDRLWDLRDVQRRQLEERVPRLQREAAQTTALCLEPLGLGPAVHGLDGARAPKTKRAPDDRGEDRHSAAAEA